MAVEDKQILAVIACRLIGVRHAIIPMEQEHSEAEALLLSIEIQRIYGGRSAGHGWFLPFSDIAGTLAFLKRVSSDSGDAGIQQALAESSANEAARRPRTSDADLAHAASVTLDLAICEAMRALGGSRNIQEVAEWISHKYGNRWKGVGTAMADLTSPPNNSTSYPAEKRCLERVKRGVYRLR